ncbi:hypothetical protein KY492_25610 [Brevibacterium sp. PAMC21349]|nr:hypothetical protein KY492_25610 [Brevibacterium sp. PAMC21349]
MDWSLLFLKVDPRKINEIDFIRKNRSLNIRIKLENLLIDPKKTWKDFFHSQMKSISLAAIVYTGLMI